MERIRFVAGFMKVSLRSIERYFIASYAYLHKFDTHTFLNVRMFSYFAQNRSNRKKVYCAKEFKNIYRTCTRYIVL